MTSPLIVSAVIVMVTLACSCSLAQLTVAPFAIAVEPAWTAKFDCTPDDARLVSQVTWQFNQTVLVGSSRVVVGNGSLVITNATYSDAGQYTCILGNDTSDATLIVYDMPDYVTEGLVIGFICLGLFVLLIVGVTIDFVKQERERKKRHKARREKAERRTDTATKY
ncbi:hypothetical protein BgiMline_033312 [Biomphalaria glabrata]|uniref:Uncharacterized protein LOC106058793 n=1 Tax=Biomphalaria glabrata TaxID=6526 RepID=A0A2C9KX81_BIOGL|nr:uncharacterized protein LOC106058793 [Biomphalaria glabrata]XP_013071744.1 uncharacterized protein LOC106058793 [Biomphalaria glabrata]XP_013071745.1 uncharacterized protein LOC106058793 [Biomphalaria glabrata]XP_055867877.1 uncharacterized protein LOC106058793 [Biomphalaria glabrata]KAI8751749.1 hypothetical protein BgiMline_016280 [Biomphalaria glabrata]KAI8770874.1 hypothetical protein BgiBS90_028760 [Biomphalaria glabrata]KAI8770876.1 hypothetical protein BgiBS90_028762 [Biomphalaria g